MSEFIPTRDAGLARLAAFAPRAGRDYARLRNFDFGPGRHDHVSALSPYLRHRLISEEDVLRATLRLHSPSAAEKFIQEVFWRGYFKGWLEHNPAVWERYRADLARMVEALESDPGLGARYQDAISGRTGIDCFDHWMGELTDTGWLHNHARMWFASIWIFTLRLPWVLGADVFYRHLVDGDPASNTLSWRWVGGLHTRGKTYLARADNIAKYTEGRFSPVGLSGTADPLVESDLPPPIVPRFADVTPPPGKFGLLLTEDDCMPLLDHAPPPSAAILGPAERSPFSTGSVASAFTMGALSDAACLLDAPASAPIFANSADLIAWAQASDLSHIISARPPVGPSRDQISKIAAEAKAAGLTLSFPARRYDRLVWPHAKKGFFGLKKKIPGLLDQLDLTGQPSLL